MKKVIVCLLMSILMIFSFALTACIANPRPDPGREIDLTVKDDSSVPEPTYSESFKTYLIQNLTDLFNKMDHELDEDEVQDLKDEINNVILPLCSKAKVSQASLRAIVDYYVSNNTKIAELIETMSAEEPPEDMKVFYTAYYALIKGAFEVLKADDVGKLLYQFCTDEISFIYDADMASIISDIGRDNFIIVSRFAFKLIAVSLDRQEDVIDETISFLDLMLTAQIGRSEGISYAEIVELCRLEIDTMYQVYSTVTDNEINKLIEICIDSYAAVYKNTNKAITDTKKNELKSEFKGMVGDYRAIVSLAYKSFKRLDTDILAEYLGNVADSEPKLYSDSESTEAEEDVKTELVAIVLRAVLDAYDNDLTAAEKTTISDILKHALTQTQYYQEIKEESYRWEHNNYWNEEEEEWVNWYYDEVTEEYVYFYYVWYDIVTVKSTEKQFDIPAQYLNDPVAMLKIAINIMGQDYEELTVEQKEIFDLMQDYGEFFGIEILKKIGISVKNSSGYSDWDIVEEREAAGLPELTEVA